MFPGEQGMSKPLARGCPSQRWEKGKPFRIQERPNEAQANPVARQTSQSGYVAAVRGTLSSSSVPGRSPFLRKRPGLQSSDGLGPAEVDAMFADLAHLHTGLCAPAQHYDDGRVLTVGHGRLATEAI